MHIICILLGVYWFILLARVLASWFPIPPSGPIATAYSFVFNATVRKPNVVTNVHDHGNVWTLYGLIEGRETMYRYERTDGGTMRRLRLVKALVLLLSL